ncbi:MAG: hypothetical protein ACK522_02400, partial [Synechococcaceae cyanobacterium]
MASLQPTLQGCLPQGQPGTSRNGSDPNWVETQVACLGLEIFNQQWSLSQQLQTTLVGKVPKVRLAPVALASSDRFSPILRWIGITLVVLTLLQMLAV